MKLNNKQEYILNGVLSIVLSLYIFATSVLSLVYLQDRLNLNDLDYFGLAITIALFAFISIISIVSFYTKKVKQ